MEDVEGFAKVLTRMGSRKILGAAIVHTHAGELLAELTLTKKHERSLRTLSGAIHVSPTLSEVNRAIGDADLRDKLRPGVRRVLARVFDWLRR